MKKNPNGVDTGKERGIARTLCDLRKSLVDSDAMLTKLASNPESEIRRRVAENCHTPLCLLFRLALDPEPLVRLAVAGNPNSPSVLVLLLSADDHVDVRSGLAANTGLSTYLLERLATDANPYVSSIATRSLEIRRRFMCHRQ